MVRRVALISDSGSDLDSGILASLGITAIPLEADLAQAEASLPYEPSFDVADERLTVALISAYENAAAAGMESIVSVHMSSQMAGAFHAARAARHRLRGVLPIEVIDTGLAGIALGFVVQRAARFAAEGATASQVAQLVRRSARNVHTMIFAESLSNVRSSPRWMRDYAGQISGNGTRPILSVEDGDLRPLERVRTRARGYDRLAEFVELFPHVDALAIYHDAPPTELESLLQRIGPVYPRERIIFGSYGPTLRSRLGSRAIGVFVDQGLNAD
ncbi:MAG: DegV family EDD domain-containing protein [Chloroflexota bacterium]|nr:MAG: DegV family EDD domain-containing protein [Chloroflexota bacterium]